MSTATNDARQTLRPARGLAALLDYAGASHRRACGLLIAFSLIAFLPGFFQIPPVDRDETLFAQATKQMLEAGQYLDIRYQDDVRYKKPVGGYWLQVLAVKAGEAAGIARARTTIWLYRLPSIMGAIGAVLLTYWTALAFVTRRGALLSALMLASSALLGAEARLATADAMLLLTCVAAMGAMARLYLLSRCTPDLAADWRLPAIFWTALAAGMLLKGPVMLMFVGLTALALTIADRSGRWLWLLRPVAGVVWFVVLILPWFVAMLVKSDGGSIAQSFGDDLLAKVFGSDDSHGAPPGYYFLLFWVTFWPGSVLAGLAALRVWQARREPGARFLLAWLLPSWLVFEAAIIKLPHYALPLYPAAAILIAGILEGGGLSTKRWLLRSTAGWFVFPAAAAIAVIVIFVVVGRDLGILAWPFAAAAAILGLFAWWLYDLDGPERSLLRAVVASLLLAITVYGVAFPSLPALFPSTVIADELHVSGCAQPEVASTYNYQEPSLVFLLGTNTRFTDGTGAALFLGQGPCRFALIDTRSVGSFGQRANSIGLHYALSQRIDGYDFSIGRSVSLTIFRSAEQP